nr:MAG TPA: adhesin [Caudoviricetes sp.]
MKKLIKAAVIVIFAMLLASCTEADKVNSNLSKQAEYFECERRVTVYNARTDQVILYAEGYLNIDNNSHNELVITAKVGSNEYKKNYVYLNAYTLYVVEDITGTHTDPYHYKLYFHTEFPVDIDPKP